MKKEEKEEEEEEEEEEEHNVIIRCKLIELFMVRVHCTSSFLLSNFVVLKLLSLVRLFTNLSIYLYF